MTTDALVYLGLGALAVWLWLDGARAREIATALARQVCERNGVQFLDGTAALARLGLRWTRQGLKLRRVFRFDYSEAGVGRHSGRVVLVGIELEEIWLDPPGAALHGLPEDGGDGPPRLP